MTKHNNQNSNGKADIDGSGTVSVTIGMLSGETKKGQLDSFDPNKDICLEVEIKESQSTRSVVQLILAKEDVSYVAFHNDLKSDPPTDNLNLQEMEIHLFGHSNFTARADPEHLSQSSGFFAFPTATFRFYEKIFFFERGIIAHEDKEPLGSILIRTCGITQQTLQQGLRDQTAILNAQGGQIQTLVKAGLATDEEIAAALDEQSPAHKKLGEVLVSLGVIKENDLAQALSQKFHLPLVDLKDTNIDSETIESIPEPLLRRYRVLPIESDADSVTVAVSNPFDLETFEMLRFANSKRLNRVVAVKSQIESHLKQFFTKTDTQNDLESEESLDEIFDTFLPPPVV